MNAQLSLRKLLTIVCEADLETLVVRDLKALLGSGMGKGPALALLLAGPALSLPNMLVIRGILGTQKTVVYCALVVVMATFTGVVFGTFYP